MKSFETFALIAVLLVAAGCDKSKERSAATVATDTAVARDTTEQAHPTDREMAHILQTSNAVILRLASLAKARIETGPVRAFADTLIANHTAFNLRAQRTFLAINTVPLDSDESKSLVAHGDSARGDLEGRAGTVFERRFVELQHTIHQRLVERSDSVFLVNARDPFLKELLQEYRGMVRNHLEVLLALEHTAFRN